MSRNFGHAPGSATHAPASADASTLEGLQRINQERGPIAAMAASAEHAMRTGKRQVVALVENPNTGETYVRPDVDAKGKDLQRRDPRTWKQQEADTWIKKHGVTARMPRFR